MAKIEVLWVEQHRKIFRGPLKDVERIAKSFCKKNKMKNELSAYLVGSGGRTLAYYDMHDGSFSRHEMDG